jgi:serine protease Do
MMVNLRRMLAMAMLAACLGALPGALDAAPPVKEPTPARKPVEQSVKEGPRGDRGFLERFGRFRALDKHERDHESVRIAYRDVVSESHKATVRVLCDDKAAALGSIVDADGYILTKASELRGRLSVKLYDNRLFDAQLIGTDHKTDLAMLKINASKLPVISWRDGADVPSVGSFLASAGLETLPVAIGVVSVQPRQIAAPSGMLGVQLEESKDGPLVGFVRPGTAAEKVGILKDDVITAVNGQPMKGREQLVDTVGKFQAGDKLTFTVKRGEKTFDVEATLGAREQTSEIERKEFQNMLGGPLSERRAGFPLAIQHDTVLTPQDCGGPLVDLDGRCVGINIARAGRVNSYALPTSVVLPLVADFKAGKYSPAQSLEALKVDLAKRWEELKQSETSLATRLMQAAETLRQLQATEEKRDELIKKAQAEQAQVESELGKVKAELSKLENQKTSLRK